jgi:hypothetical protein
MQQDPPIIINTQAQLDKACDNLTNAIQETISKVVPVNTICAKIKQWWTKELTTLCKESKRLGRQSYKHRDKPFHWHFTHAQHADATKLYHRTLDATKMHHWRDWLERAEDPDIWSLDGSKAASSTSHQQRQHQNPGTQIQSQKH